MGQTERRVPDDPVRQALAALGDPGRSAVLVVGPPGSGKSRVLSELQAQPEAGRMPRLVTLDDADQLRPAELARIAELLDRREVRLVATVRTVAAGAVLRDLRPVRPPAVVELRPWGRAQLAAYVAEQTGGQLDEPALRRLLRLSGGNPLCLTELVDTGLAAGRLHRAYECWTWSGPLAVPPVTAARVADELDRLPGPVRDVHAAVALVGTVPLAVLEAVCDPAAVEAAENAGVLRVELSGRRMLVQAASAVAASVEVQTLAAIRRRRLSAALAGSLLRAGGRRADDPLRIAYLLWHAAADIPPELRAGAAALAHRAHDPAFAAALGAAPAAGTGVWRRAVAGTRALARGRVEQAERCGTDLRTLGLAEDWPYAYGLGALLGGRCGLATGSVRAAARLLSEGLAVLTDPGLRAYGLVHLALAYTLAGRTDVADRALRDADRLEAPPGPRTELARAEILLARARPSGALRIAAAVAAGTRDERTRAAALHLCVRIQPAAETADRLAAVGLPDPLAAVRLRHARAAVAGDGPALAEVAAGYERTGLHWLAAETAAASLACARPDQRAEWATADRRLLERVAARADVDLPELWWRGGDRFAPLTQREREITELAAGGWSSPRIAGHLHLSRRTIENHLQHSYRKLGITRREELAAVIGRRG
jgi:DNA-binding CsgD family transcriptional regulator